MLYLRALGLIGFCKQNPKKYILKSIIKRIFLPGDMFRIWVQAPNSPASWFPIDPEKKTYKHDYQNFEK